MEKYLKVDNRAMKTKAKKSKQTKLDIKIKKKRTIVETKDVKIILETSSKFKEFTLIHHKLKQLHRFGHLGEKGKYECEKDKEAKIYKQRVEKNNGDN